MLSQKHTKRQVVLCCWNGFGFKTFLTTSEGIEIQSPLFFSSLKRELKKQQRVHSKKKGQTIERKTLENLQ